MKNTTKQRIAVTWEASGFIEVEGASSIKEAMEMVKQHPNNYPMPYESEYVEDSFRLVTEDVQEMEEICS